MQMDYQIIIIRC